MEARVSKGTCGACFRTPDSRDFLSFFLLVAHNSVRCCSSGLLFLLPYPESRTIMHPSSPALSRRSFLHGAAAAAAALPLLEASADETKKKPASDRLTL